MEVNHWQGRQVLVTGATGFVGSWLVKELLARGAVVTVLINEREAGSMLLHEKLDRQTTVVEGTLQDYGTVERAVENVDTVFHLGAETLVGEALQDPMNTFESNIRGTYHVLEACRKRKTPFHAIIVASSDKAYGDCDDLPYTEETPLAGRHPYDVSKSCTDLLALTYAETYALPVRVARCGNIYGGGDMHESRIVPGTIRSLQRGEAPIIRSDGTYLRDYLYVTDVVRAYLLLADAELPGGSLRAFNFGPNQPTSVLKIVEMITRLMHCEHLQPKILNEAKAEIHDQYLSSALAKKLLGWSPAVGLEEGLEKTIAWYAES